jgi:PAS domain S-box-containing protein
MSVADSQIDSPDTDDRVPSIAEDPEVLLENILSGKNLDRALDGLVNRLGQTSYSIMDLLGDVTRLKEKMVTAGTPVDSLIDRWSLLDRTVGECVALTSLSHEKFIENTLHAFCEYDHRGIIISANARMVEHDPECLGQDLASRFGSMEQEVRLALKTGPRLLYQLEWCASGGCKPVLAEFGKIETSARSGGYALLVDRTELEEAEHKALEAAPYGMLKLDARHRIVYATEKALKLFGGPLEELLGRDVRSFITDENSREEIFRQRIKRERGKGDEYEVLVAPPRSDKQVHLRVRSVPSFDAAGQFSGTIAALQPIDHEVAREDIARLVATESDYGVLFDGMMKVVQRFIPFFSADLWIYTPERDYARAIRRFGSSKRFPARWFSIPPAFRNWITYNETWIADLQAYLSATPEGRPLLEDPSVRLLIEEGVKATVSLPIQEGGRIIGALSLLSQQPGVYDAQTRKTLERLMLDQALLAVLHAHDQAEQEFVANLMKEIASSHSHKELAQKVVTEFVKFYHFQNVSIFKVATCGRSTSTRNVPPRHFKLFAQDGDIRIPDGYTQPLEDGMLGLTYRSGRYKILPDADDLNDTSEERRSFVRVAKEVRSELCIPIEWAGRILWILNFEDRQSRAFTLAEVKKLQGVIEQLQTTLERMFQGLILEQVLEGFPYAVVITEPNDNILLCNKKALRLFEREQISAEDKLSQFFRGSNAAADFWAGDAPTTATVVRRRGKEISVLVSTFRLPEEYDHVVLVLQDVTELQWKTDFESLKAALAESAAQVRVPVSLLSSFVQQIGKKIRQPKVRELITKAMRQLGRVELTYDRVLASYGAQKLPTPRKDRINLNRALNHILSELPALERESVELSTADRPAVVRADSYRVLFALSSMLGYLLRSRANAEPIVIDVQVVNGSVEVLMTGTVHRTPSIGKLAALVETTRTEIALGQDAIERVAKECEGTFERAWEANGHERLSLRLAAT